MSQESVELVKALWPPPGTDIARLFGTRTPSLGSAKP